MCPNPSPGPEPPPIRPFGRPTTVLAVVMVGVGLYLVLFFLAPLPSLTARIGDTWRISFFLQYFVHPGWLADGWFGGSPILALAERLPVLLLACLILTVGTMLGWLLLAVLRIDRILTGLETFVFSAGVGMNVVSTYVLLVGLMGLLHNPLALMVPAALVLAATGRLWSRRLLTAPLSNRPPAASRQASVPQDPGAQESAKPTGKQKTLTSRSRRKNKRPRAATSAAPSPAPECASPAQDPGDADMGPFGARWLWLAAPFVAIILLGGMLPPSEFDVREYHLQVPKEWHQQGRIDFLPHNVYGSMPLGAEMHALLAMTIAGDWWRGALAGKMVIASFALLTALALVAAGRRFFTQSAGVVAAVIYLSIPWILRVSTNGLIEGVLAFYLFLAVYAVLLAVGKRVAPSSLTGRSDPSIPTEVLDRAGSLSPSPAPPATPNREEEPVLLPTAQKTPFRSLPASGVALWLLAGYLAGAAASCKYPAVLFVIVPLAAWVLLARRARGAPRHGRFPLGWKPLAAFLVAAAAGCGLWFGKNWVLTGNPAYPLLAGVFPSQTRTPELIARWNAAHAPGEFTAAALIEDLARVALYSEWLAPMLMPLAALALLPRRRRKLVLCLLAYFAFVIAAWWLSTHRIDRFWIPTLPLVALLAGVGAGWSGSRAWRVGLLALLLVSMVWCFLVATSGTIGYKRFFARLPEVRTDAGRVKTWHRWINDNVPVFGGGLMVGDAEVFDIEVPILYSTCFDPTPLEAIVKDRTPSEIRAEFAGRGVTHVYVDWGEIERYRSEHNYGFPEFVQPDVFERLVGQGILEPLPPIEGHRGRCYRVILVSP